jgi:hypothetical protein
MMMITQAYVSGKYFGDIVLAFNCAARHTNTGSTVAVEHGPGICVAVPGPFCG